MWRRGNLEPSWQEKDYKEAKYTRKQANSNLVVEWKRKGYLFEEYTGLMCPVIDNVPEWMRKISKEVGLTECGYTLYKMPPAVVMPLHVDHMEKYCKVFNTEKKDVYRCIVALEDWQSGHYFEIEGNPIVGYKAGEYIIWSSDVEHMAANIGPNTRYTLQITGKKL